MPWGDVIAAARRAWPEIGVTDDVVRCYLVAHPGTHTADLFLACAIVNGDPAAIRVFETQILPKIDPVAKRIVPEPDFADELRQRVRTHVLVGAPPRIVEYQGSGSLSSWVRVVAIRLGIEVLRSRRAESQRVSAAAAEPAFPYRDLERELLKARYRGPVREAFASAMDALSPHERNLMQLHFVNGLGVREIGALHNISKSTVARWIATARTTLEAAFRDRLGTTLQITQSEVDSLLGVLRSSLDLSVERLLGGRT